MEIHLEAIQSPFQFGPEYPSLAVMEAYRDQLYERWKQFEQLRAAMWDYRTGKVAGDGPRIIHRFGDMDVILPRSHANDYRDAIQAAHEHTHTELGNVLLMIQVEKDKSLPKPDKITLTQDLSRKLDVGPTEEGKTP